MGEMSVRRRPRKDLAASFHRLRRMVVDVKSARKSLAAHHSLVAELVSVSLFPSLKDSLPRSHLQPDGSQAETPLPLSVLSPKPPTNLPDRGCLAPLQLNDTQDVGGEAQNSVLCSSASSKNRISSSFLSLRSLTSKISGSLSSTGEGSDLLRLSPPCQETESRSRRVLKSTAHPGIRLSQPAFWASLFLVFLCFFLCTGKELAVFVAISAYTIIWLIRRLRTIVRLACESRHSSCHDEDYAQDRQSGNLLRSLTIPPRNKSVHFGSPNSEVPIRSQSVPELHSCLQKAGCSKEPDLSLYYESSRVSSKDLKSFPARIKLGMILALALCGLVYGQIAAVCMCSCCILAFPATQGFPFRRCSASKKAS